MRWRPLLTKSRFEYGLSQKQVDDFIEKNASIREFLNQYKANESTYTKHAVGLCRFFSWLKMEKEIDISPTQFLNMHIQKRNTDDVDGRRWALKLAIEYSRDNPDLADQATSYKYTSFYLPIKMFCDYNEAPLTSTKGLFKKRDRRKYKDALTTRDFIKRALTALNQRDRAVSLVQLQSGQGIQQVLIDINRQGKRILQEIDAGKERIRFDFDERKGNGFAYFSFISRDAIQEIQKWRALRQRILDDQGIKSDYLFITSSGEPLTCKSYHTYSRVCYIKAKLYTGPLSVRSHLYRKFFEQEASPPERGISRSYTAFMMGHSNGDGSQNHLDAVGGVYDRAPKVYPSAVEKEYAKLEPYINVFSEKVDQPGDNEAMKQEIADLRDKIGKIENSSNLLAVLKVLGSEDAATLIKNYEKTILKHSKGEDPAIPGPGKHIKRTMKSQNSR